MSGSSALTYARTRVGGGSALTYARVLVDRGGSALTYAKVIPGPAPFVDTGQSPLILMPLCLGELRASVTSGTVTAWSWRFVSSTNPKVTSITLTQDGLGGATYETPATIGGTILTFEATAVVSGVPLVGTVDHIIRHHSVWRVVSAGPVFTPFRVDIIS